MGAQGGAPSDLLGGQHAHYPAAQVGDATVDPQQLMIQPNGFGMHLPGQVLGADFGSTFLGGPLDTYQLGQLAYYGTELADTPNFPVTYPEFAPCSPAGDFISGAHEFLVTFPAESHALGN